MAEKIKMYDVHSSNVAKVGWYKDETTQKGVCVIEFVKGARYMYYPVSQEKFGEVFESKAKGKWVQDNLIRNKNVECTKLGQPKLEL